MIECSNYPSSISITTHHPVHGQRCCLIVSTLPRPPYECHPKTFRCTVPLPRECYFQPRCDAHKRTHCPLILPPPHTGRAKQNTKQRSLRTCLLGGTTGISLAFCNSRSSAGSFSAVSFDFGVLSARFGGGVLGASDGVARDFNQWAISWRARGGQGRGSMKT